MSSESDPDEDGINKNTSKCLKWEDDNTTLILKKFGNNKIKICG